jgi:hypothetical protein
VEEGRQLDRLVGLAEGEEDAAGTFDEEDS